MAPVRFLLGFHLHQPIGNFDHVFADHVRLVYAPLLDALESREAFPAAFHVSGPLVEWLEAHEPAVLDRLGRLVSDEKIELLAAGWTEPILSSLLRPDRVMQVEWAVSELRRRFGVEAHGLWLTERVWSPELPADLVDAGITHALVDDRHLLASGVSRTALHRPHFTESDGRRLGVLAIDERLRYLIPFQPPEATGQYLRDLHAAGQPLAILADDGEKFGGWPGTHDWVYGQGWFGRFFDELDRLRGDGVMELGRFHEAVTQVPSGGLVYLPTASYREMEGWALPAPAAARLSALEHELGEGWLSGENGALIRGSHWRNFLARYAESNRMHKKAQHLSELCRQRGDPAPARRAIARAQCNDAYWHGVFGGLYLPHLRHAVWRELAHAESLLRHGEPLAVECLDFDYDGMDELWIHGATMSALVSPARGGTVEELTWLGREQNLCDTLTRRLEAYHTQAVAPGKAADEPGTGAPSIHDLERGMTLAALPPVDHDDRTLFRERVLAASVTADAWARADYRPEISWTRCPFEWAAESTSEGLSIGMHGEDVPLDLVKRLTFAPDGSVRAMYEWSPSAESSGVWFTVELTLAHDAAVDHDAAEDWRAPVETVSKSERGFDRTVQGTGILLRWPVGRGQAAIRIS